MQHALPPLTEYTIEPGDALVTVAQQFGTSVEALRIANDLTNVDLVQIGQVLNVPPAETLLETVDPTVSIQDIARRYEVDPAVLAAYNGLDATRVDAPLGRDTVIVPDLSRLAAPEPDATSVSEETLYTVVEGDTLLSIAAEFDVEPEALLAANQRDDPNWLVVGEQLRIPTTE